MIRITGIFHPGDRRRRSPGFRFPAVSRRTFVLALVLASLCGDLMAILDAGGPPNSAGPHRPLPRNLLRPDPLFAQAASATDAVDSAECGRLYSHQLAIVQSDPDNPLYSSVQLNQGVLENPETRDAEIQHCLTRVNRESFRCQMQAKDLAGLLDCRRRFGPDANRPGDPAGDSDKGPDATEAYFEDVSPANADPAPKNNQTGAGGQTGGPETLPSGRLLVNRANCQRAYAHIYDVISKSAEFRARQDRARLENYWQSSEAKDSFATRCVAKFQPADLGCLLSTRDSDVLQGCLLVIPPG
jgi:hypothetical protein